MQLHSPHLQNRIFTHFIPLLLQTPIIPPPAKYHVFLAVAAAAVAAAVAVAAAAVAAVAAVAAAGAVDFQEAVNPDLEILLEYFDQEIDQVRVQGLGFRV